MQLGCVKAQIEVFILFSESAEQEALYIVQDRNSKARVTMLYTDTLLKLVVVDLVKVHLEKYHSQLQLGITIVPQALNS